MVGELIIDGLKGDSENYCWSASDQDREGSLISLIVNKADI